MKESSKKELRKMMKIFMVLLLILGLSIMPILKLLNVVEATWVVAFIPLFMFIGFQLIWLLGYFSCWLAEPGTED